MEQTASKVLGGMLLGVPRGLFLAVPSLPPFGVIGSASSVPKRTNPDGLGMEGATSSLCTFHVRDWISVLESGTAERNSQARVRIAPQPILLHTGAELRTADAEQLARLRLVILGHLKSLENTLPLKLHERHSLRGEREAFPTSDGTGGDLPGSSVALEPRLWSASPFAARVPRFIFSILRRFNHCA
jgi:hypothetical protein